MDNLQVLKQIKCFILDLDGTVYLGKKVLDGSMDFLEILGEKTYSSSFLPITHLKMQNFM